MKRTDSRANRCNILSSVFEIGICEQSVMDCAQVDDIEVANAAKRFRKKGETTLRPLCGGYCKRAGGFNDAPLFS